MMDGIKEESVGLLFNVEVDVAEAAPVQAEGASVVIADGLMAPKAPAQLEYTAPTVDGAGEVMHRTVASASDTTADVDAEQEASGPARTRGKRTRSKGRRR
jgi:preprotein translocase subunit SecA